jgi:hypothetical protein
MKENSNFILGYTSTFFFVLPNFKKIATRDKKNNNNNNLL